jgi:SPP1 family predicted phage head-tail adaptor
VSLIATLFNNSFVQSRRERSDDGQGGWTVAYNVVATLQGRLRPASSEERSIARQDQRHLTHVFYCLAGTDVARGDLLSGDGVTVDVLGVREPSRAGHHLEVDCEETQRETNEESGS